MNILYDYQIFATQQYGGISRYFYELVKRISKIEEVNLFEGFYINKYGIENEKDIHKLFAHKRITKRGGRVYALLNKWLLENKSSKKNINIYHPTYYGLCDVKADKTIVTVYDMIHEIFPQYFSQNDSTKDDKRKILNKSDKIIAISKQTKKDIINILDINPEKIDVIYLANSLTLVPDRNKRRDKPFFLYVGNRGIYKNFMRVLDAFARSKHKNDIELVCFGGGKFNHIEYEKIHSLNLDDNVQQVFGDDQVLANLYSEAIFFIYPSEYEGFGIPPLESMHYQTPVLCSNVSSIPEVVGSAGLYFSPTNIDEISYSIDKILDDGALRENLKRMGVEREKTFSWDRCADETLKLYQNALKE